MKVQTNIRAGRKSADNAPGDTKKGRGSDDPAPVYVPPVSRCVGI